MAIAFDAKSNASFIAQSAGTVAHTCTGANLVLAVCSSVESNVGPTNNPITGITYNSVALTKIRSDQRVDSNRSEIWYLINPSTGANNIIVTYTGLTEGGVIGGISLTGVDQNSPLDANAGGTTHNGTLITGTITTIAANAWVVDSVHGAASTGTLTGSASQTQRYEDVSAAHCRGGASTNGPIATPGTVGMTWTASASETEGVISIASFAPVASGPTGVTPGFKTLMGAGN